MKIIGVGLNKTGTKTLKSYLEEMGFRHQTYSLEYFNEYRKGNYFKLFDVMDQYDSFEDWPWPLMYKQVDEHYPDALFILTVRKSPEEWYLSLCKMAVRMGPFNDFEKHIYGYAMPHGRKQEHIDFYIRHNQAVEEYFEDRPEKLLKICWGEEDDGNKVARFLGRPEVNLERKHVNVSKPVYAGDNWWLAQISRVLFQTNWYLDRWFKNTKRRIKTWLRLTAK